MNNVFITQDDVLRFNPGAVVIDSSTEDGTLRKEFTLIYGVSESLVQTTNSSLGEIEVDAPFETLNVHVSF